MLFGNFFILGSYHLLNKIFLCIFCHDLLFVGRNQDVLFIGFGLKETQVMGDDFELILEKFEIVDDLAKNLFKDRLALLCLDSNAQVFESGLHFFNHPLAVLLDLLGHGRFVENTLQLIFIY